MKRGIKWHATHPPGIDRLDPDQRFMGYPLRMANPGDRLNRLRRWAGIHAAAAEARGILWWKRIEITPKFFRLSGAQQQAVLLHEAGHLKRRHNEKRILLAPFCKIPFFRRIAWRHEMEADELAVRTGYGRELAAYLASNYAGDGEFYPPFLTRIANINRVINEVHHAQKAA